MQALISLTQIAGQPFKYFRKDSKQAGWEYVNEKNGNVALDGSGPKLGHILDISGTKSKCKLTLQMMKLANRRP